MKKLFYLLLIFSLAGCGTRKRAVNISTIEKGVELSQKNDITTNAKITKSTSKTTYTPIDHSKEMTLPDGRKSTNAIIEESQEQQLDILSNVDKSDIDFKRSEKSRDKTVNTETKKPNPWLWGTLAIIGLGIVYFGYRKLMVR